MRFANPLILGRVLSSLTLCLAFNPLVLAHAQNDIVKKDDAYYLRTDRYTLVSMDVQSEQISPLLAPIHIQYSNDVKSVADALNELLAGSGYRWNADKPANHLFSQFELPLINRSIGPLRLRDALMTMVGEPWRLHVDEVNRTLWFELKADWKILPSLQWNKDDVESETRIQ